MDTIKGVFELSAQFNNPEPVFCNSIIEFFQKKDDFPSQYYSEKVENIDGLKELVGPDLLYGFMMDSGDFLLIQSIENDRCRIFILWTSNISISELLSSFVIDINNKIKKGWKRSNYYSIPRAKLKLNDTEKILIYRSYEGRTLKIDPENAISFLNFSKRNEKFPTHKIIYNGLLFFLCVTAAIVAFQNKEFFYLIIGILIPAVLSIIEQFFDRKYSSNYLINVENFRVLPEIGKDEEDTNEDVNDPI